MFSDNKGASSFRWSIYAHTQYLCVCRGRVVGKGGEREREEQVSDSE
jgi:hypothetical protein